MKLNAVGTAARFKIDAGFGSSFQFFGSPHVLLLHLSHSLNPVSDVGLFLTFSILTTLVLRFKFLCSLPQTFLWCIHDPPPNIPVRSVNRARARRVTQIFRGSVGPLLRRRCPSGR